MTSDLSPAPIFLLVICFHFFAEEERRKGYKKKNFKQAKLDFVDQMLDWSGAKSPAGVLDVGCGIGGTTRILARKFPDAQVKGEPPSEVSVIQQCCHCLPYHPALLRLTAAKNMAWMHCLDLFHVLWLAFGPDTICADHSTATSGAGQITHGA